MTLDFCFGSVVGTVSILSVQLPAAVLKQLQKDLFKVTVKMLTEKKKPKNLSSKFYIHTQGI